MFKLIAPLALLLASLPLVACQNDDDIKARSAEIAELPGMKITVSGVELGHDKAQAIAKHLEGKAIDTGAAMVRIKKDEYGKSSLEVELYAATLPSVENLAADLKAAFPELAGATIAAAPAQGGGPQPLPMVEVGPELTPEEAKQEIIEALQAQGVDGQIDVQVQDGEDGRRIEVKVEKEVNQQ